jgi:hypothetical protein
MMQPADQGMRHNSSDPLNWARDRRILRQGAMSSRRVVIARIGFYESAQVLLTQCKANFQLSFLKIPSGLGVASAGRIIA